MGFCYELKEGPMGCHIRNAINVALCYYFLFGFFIVCFVYTNYCYPEWYYIDYMIGVSGASLMGVVLIGSIFVHRDSCQPIRYTFGLCIPLNVLLVAVSSFYYTIERWYDVEVTVLVKIFRTPVYRDFPDDFWRALAVLLCINSFVCLIYLPYIMSFMCNKRKLYLFVGTRRYADLSPFSPFTIQSAPSSNPHSTNR